MIVCTSTGRGVQEIQVMTEVLMRKTKIICTLGPAVDDAELVRILIEGGMDAARFNFSHGSHP